MNGEKRYRNFETGIENLKDRMREILHGYKIYYELSSAGKAWHFEILCDEEEEEILDEFLDHYFENEYLALRAS